MSQGESLGDPFDPKSVSCSSLCPAREPEEREEILNPWPCPQHRWDCSRSCSFAHSSPWGSLPSGSLRVSYAEGFTRCFCKLTVLGSFSCPKGQWIPLTVSQLQISCLSPTKCLRDTTQGASRFRHPCHVLPNHGSAAKSLSCFLQGV